MDRRQGQATFLSSETLAGVAAVWLLLATVFSFFFEAIPKTGPGSLSFGLTLLLLVLGLAPIIWVNVYRAGWRRTQTRLNGHFNDVVAEGRPFMLYLRPFVTSGRIKAPNDWPHFGQRMLLGDPWELELALATVIGTDTPLIAIGDVEGGYGAAKLTTSDDDWRGHMQRLARDARLIIAVPLDRPSTLWEMEEIGNNDSLREKAVFVMPPSSRFYDFLFFFFRRSIAARWRRSARRLKEKGLVLPRYWHRGGFFLVGPDGRPSKIAGFRLFKPDYVDSMLTELSTDGARPANRVAWFNAAYGGTRWLRPRLFGELSLMGWYTPAGVKRVVLFGLFWLVFSTLAFHLRSIPSEHMAPSLLVGDRVAASNFAYGYTRASIPFGLGLLFIPDDPDNPDERLFGQAPKRGDVVIFMHTHNDLIHIERVIGLPGDTVEMRNGRLILNGEMIERGQVRRLTYAPDDSEGRVTTAIEYSEQLPGEQKPHLIHEWSDNSDLDETPVFKVPAGHVFMMGDNRDNSEDSRAPSGHRSLVAQFPEAWPYRGAPPGDPKDDAMGFVPFDHLIARAETVLFSLHSCPQVAGAECLNRRLWQKP